MPRHLAFLRAINVGGRTVKMDILRDLFEGFDLARVETFIASGNVIFESRRRPQALEGEIEAGLRDALGYDVATFLRSPGELSDVVRFAEALQAEHRPVATNVGFLKAPLNPAQTAQVLAFSGEFDAFHVQGREIHWLCRVKQSQSAFSNMVLERTLKLPATWRSLSTLRKLADKYSE